MPHRKVLLCRDISYWLSQKYVSRDMMYIVSMFLCIPYTYNRISDIEHSPHRQSILPHINNKAPQNTLSVMRCHKSRNCFTMNSFCKSNDISHKHPHYCQSIPPCKYIDPQSSPCNFVPNMMCILLEDPRMSGNCMRREYKPHSLHHRKIFGEDKHMSNLPPVVFQ